jgi:hypothetical protein
MATPGELCNKAAELLGLEPNVTATAWRILRDNTEVTTGGRGRSAAHCVASDAAKLLIASVGKLPLLSTYKSWGRYSRLPAWNGQFISARKPDGHVGLRWEVAVPELEELGENHTFGDGVQGLMQAAVSGSLQKALQIHSAGTPRVEVRLLGPLPQAGISISLEKGRHSFSNTIAYADFPRCDVDMSKLFDWAADRTPPLEERSDLQTILSFGSKTIFTLGELLRSGKVSQ